jgi:hypothetical protein
MSAKSKLTPGITLNFFGEGYNLLRFDESRLPFATLETRAAELNMELDRAVLDLEFYEPFKPQNINSWKDITRHVTRGSLVSRLSWMEIRSEGKKRKTTNLEELFLTETLFPLCDFTIADQPVVKSTSGSFYILEKEVGKIDTFFLEGTIGDLENLQFGLEQFSFPSKKLLLLSNVSCRGEALMRKETDTVVSTMRTILT